MEAVTRTKSRLESSRAIKEEKRKGKRGVKPDDNYLTSAVDNLENLYLDYQEFPYKKGATVEEKKERARRRNEISALESRIHKKLEEEKQ